MTMNWAMLRAFSTAITSTALNSNSLTRKMAATAGYGKFKEGLLNDTKTAYGELEGFFGGGSVAGSAVGAFYNNFNKGYWRSSSG